MDFAKLYRRELFDYVAGGEKSTSRSFSVPTYTGFNTINMPDVTLAYINYSNMDINGLIRAAAEKFTKHINAGEIDKAYSTAAIVALDRSVRYPQNTTNRYSRQEIFNTNDENTLDIFAQIYNIQKDTHLFRSILFRILELQGLIIEPTEPGRDHIIVPISNNINMTYGRTINRLASTK